MTPIRSAVAVGLLVTLTACGSQLSEREIATRTAGTAALSAAGGQEATGAGTSGTDVQGPGGSADLPGATTDGADGTGTAAGTTSDASGSGAGSTGTAAGGTGSAGTGQTGTGATGTGTAGGASGSGSGSGTAPAASDAPAGGSGTDNAPARRGGDIVIGNVGTVSGVAGTALAPVQRGVQVWVKAVNARGGIDGRKVRLVTADDGSSTAKHQQIVQQMVEKDRVVAFVGNPNAQTLTKSTLSYLERKDVPLVGTDTGSDLNYASRVVFPQASASTASGQASVFGVVKAGLADGKKKFGLVTCQEVAVCNTTYSNWDALVTKAGGTSVYKAQTSLGQPSFTSECLGARNAGVQVLFYIGDPNSLVRLARSCKSQGLDAKLAAPSQIVIGSMAKDANFRGAYISSVLAPWFTSATPAQKEYLDAFERFAGGEPAGGDMSGWASGKLLEAALRGKPADVTGKTIMDGLAALKDESLGGLTYPLSFTKGKAPTPRPCSTVVRIADKGGFTAPGKGEITCY